MIPLTWRLDISLLSRGLTVDGCNCSMERNLISIVFGHLAKQYVGVATPSVERRSGHALTQAAKNRAVVIGL